MDNRLVQVTRKDSGLEQTVWFIASVVGGIIAIFVSNALFFRPNASRGQILSNFWIMIIAGPIIGMLLGGLSGSYCGNVSGNGADGCWRV
jgi:hypothetical protein